jgi:Flp pilus assembly protein TadG
MADPLRLLAFNFKRLLAEDGGVAAVEMSIIAPVALLFLSVAVAGGQTLTLYHKTVLAAHTVTDLVSRTPYQKDTITNTAQAEMMNESDLDTDLMLSQMIYYPNDATNLQVVMSELQVNAQTNQGTVIWSEGCNGATPLKVGAVLNLDPSYSALGAQFLLYGQVNNTFQPLGVTLSLAPITLSSTEMLTIRNATSITINWNSKTC